MHRAWLLVLFASACGPAATNVADLGPAVDQSTLVDQSIPIDQSTLFDQSIPIDQSTVFDQSIPIDQSTLFDQSIPIDQSTVFDQSIPIDQSTLFDQSIPIDQSTLVDQSPAIDHAAAPDLARPPPDLSSPPDLARTSVAINFDDLVTGVYVTDQYAPYAVFSSSTGNAVWTVPYASITNFSPPNCACSGAVGAAYASCTLDLYVDFPHTADGLTLEIGSYTTGVVAQLNVYSGGTLAATLPVDIQGSMVGQVIDLSSYAPVTRIELVMITAPYGIGVDEIRFSAVP
jgi:hypothetical protein